MGALWLAIPKWARVAQLFGTQQGVVMIDFPEKGNTIKGAYFASLIQKLHEDIKTKRRGILTKDVRLLRDNAEMTKERMSSSQDRASRDYDILSYAPFSPDLAPSDGQSCLRWWGHDIWSHFMISNATCVLRTCNDCTSQEIVKCKHICTYEFDRIQIIPSIILSAFARSDGTSQSQPTILINLL